MRSTVRNAAKWAVYDETTINVKNQKKEAAMRPDIDLGEKLHPCCMKAPNENQNEFVMLNSFASTATDGDDASIDCCCCRWFWWCLRLGVGGIWSTDSPAGKLNINKFTTHVPLSSLWMRAQMRIVQMQCCSRIAGAACRLFATTKRLHTIAFVFRVCIFLSPTKLASYTFVECVCSCRVLLRF